MTPVKGQAATDLEFKYKVVGEEDASFGVTLRRAFSGPIILVPLLLVILLMVCICCLIKWCVNRVSKKEEKDGANELAEETSVEISKKDLEKASLEARKNKI